MPSALGDLGREKVKVFWRYTQNIWQKSNVPPNKRLETIMQAYDTESLSELFDTIMQRNEKVLEYAKNMKCTRANWRITRTLTAEARYGY
jgi:hypothetical protein